MGHGHMWTVATRAAARGLVGAKGQMGHRRPEGVRNSKQMAIPGNECACADHRGPRAYS